MIGSLSVGLLRLLRRFDRDRSADFAGWTMRRVGPLLRGHRVARAQLAMAFPDKTPAEIETIALGMWDNLGRVAIEYAHFDRLWDYDWQGRRPGRIVMDDETAERAWRFRDDRRGAMIFGAHLANWEVPPLAARSVGREMALVFRMPRIPAIAEALTAVRSREVTAVIPAGPDTAFRIREALRRNWIVGFVIDQHSERGVEVTFFGRRCKVNPMIARLARAFERPIYGGRVIRLPQGRFRFELSEPLALPRDAEGKVEVVGTMQLITTMIEGWVREHPEQWMWIHRRWR